MERLALPLPVDRKFAEMRVDSASLCEFLGDPTNPRNLRVILPTRFALPVELRSASSELYLAKKIDYIFDEETRLKAEAQIEEKRAGISPDDIRTQTALDRIKENQREFHSVQAVVERYRAIYYDFSAQEIKQGPIKQGKHSEVEVDTYDILAQGHKPMLEMHTHPRNSLPSPIDYARIIYDLSVIGEQRALRGILVLCPDFQVLALATPQTLLVPIKKANELIKLYSEPSEADQERADWLQHWFKKLNQAPTKTMSAFTLRLVEEVTDTLAKSEKAGMDEAKWNELADRRQAALATEMALKGKEVSDKYAKALPRAHSRLYSHIEAMENRVSIDFARMIAVNLYMSTDMENYTAFSA